VCGGRRPASGGRRPAGGVRRPVCGTERPASGVWRAGYWMEGADKLSIQGVWGTIVSPPVKGGVAVIANFEIGTIPHSRPGWLIHYYPLNFLPSRFFDFN